MLANHSRNSCIPSLIAWLPYYQTVKNEILPDTSETVHVTYSVVF